MPYQPKPLSQMDDIDYITQVCVSNALSQLSPIAHMLRVEEATFTSKSTGVGESDTEALTGTVSIRFFIPTLRKTITVEMDVEDSQPVELDTLSLNGKTYRINELERVRDALLGEYADTVQYGKTPMGGLTVRNIQDTRQTTIQPGPHIYRRGWTDTDRLSITATGGGKMAFEFNQEFNETLRAVRSVFQKMAEINAIDTTVNAVPQGTPTTELNSLTPGVYRRLRPVPAQQTMQLSTYPIFYVDRGLWLHTNESGTGMIGISVSKQDPLAKIVGEYVEADAETKKTAIDNLKKACTSMAGQHTVWDAAIKCYRTTPYALVRMRVYYKPSDRNNTYNDDDIFSVRGVNKVHNIIGSIDTGLICVQASYMEDMTNNITLQRVIIFRDVLEAYTTHTGQPVGKLIEELLPLVPEDLTRDSDSEAYVVTETKNKTMHPYAKLYTFDTVAALCDFLASNSYDYSRRMPSFRVGGVSTWVDVVSSAGHVIDDSIRDPNTPHYDYLVPIEVRPIVWLDAPDMFADVTAALLPHPDGVGYLGYAHDTSMAPTLTVLTTKHAAQDWVVQHGGQDYVYAKQAVEEADRGRFVKVAGLMMESASTLTYDATTDRYSLFSSAQGLGTFVGPGGMGGSSNALTGLSEDEVRLHLGRMGINALGQDTAIRKAKLTGRAVINMSMANTPNSMAQMSPYTTEIVNGAKKTMTAAMIGTAGLGLVDWLAGLAKGAAAKLESSMIKGSPICAVYQTAKSAADSVPYVTDTTAVLYEKMALLLDGTEHAAADLETHRKLADIFRRVSVECADNAC